MDSLSSYESCRPRWSTPRTNRPTLGGRVSMKVPSGTQSGKKMRLKNKGIAKLGGYGYDLLILINRSINHLLQLMGREKMSLSKQVKNGVKKAVSWIGNFEQTAAELAIENGYEYVICGHIHQPQHRIVKTEKGSVVYLNSGDWVENLTALEYDHCTWTIYQHDEQNEKASKHLKPEVPSRKPLSIEDLLAEQLILNASSLK